MKRLLRYINPIAHLGHHKYSYFFPFVTVVSFYILSEIFTYNVLKDPMGVGLYVIYLSVILIIYFSFREGLRGGILSTILTISYYLYIIATRHYKGNQRTAGIETTAILGIIFLIVSITIGWLKQTIDILIEREMDEKNRLQAIIQQLPVGVLITDEKGRIVQGNKQVDIVLGRQMRRGLVAGEATLPTVTSNGKPISPTHWPLAQAILTGKAVPGREFILEQDSGKKVFLQISASLIRNKEGKVIAAASIINDITHRKEIEKRKDDFVNMASHELKTPITSMKLYIESLIRRTSDSDDERTIKTLGSIKKQTERLQELVNGLLDVSRLQTGKLSFSKVSFRLDILAEELTEELRATTKKHTLIYSGKTPLIVFADKFRIYQVLTNLITNAIKYSPDATTITIRVKKADGKAVVSIKDEGIGIVKEQQKRIFDRLYQVADSDTNTFPGLGMGLYISKEIIKRHKGSIWVESEKVAGRTDSKQGSIFYFTLPLTKLP
jgi:PAS domain S-box-containing protein